jgi:hypothetical protein
MRESLLFPAVGDAINLIPKNVVELHL